MSIEWSGEPTADSWSFRLLIRLFFVLIAKNQSKTKGNQTKAYANHSSQEEGQRKEGIETNLWSPSFLLSDWLSAVRHTGLS